MSVATGVGLLDAEGAAEVLGLKVSTIRLMTCKKEIPCVRPTGRRLVRYRLADLEALLRKRTQPALRTLRITEAPANGNGNGAAAGGGN